MNRTVAGVYANPEFNERQYEIVQRLVSNSIHEARKQAQLAQGDMRKACLSIYDSLVEIKNIMELSRDVKRYRT